MKNDKTFIITSKYWSKGGHERMYHKVKLEREAWGVSKTVTGIVEGTDFYTDLKSGVVYPTEMPSKCRGSMLDALYEALTATTTKTSEEVVEEVVVEKDEEYYEDCGDICAYMTKSEGWDEVAKLPKVEKEFCTSLGDWEGSTPLAHVQEEAKTAYYNAGCWSYYDASRNDKDLVYQGYSWVEDTSYEHLRDHLNDFAGSKDLTYTSELTQDEVEQVRSEWYVHLTEAEVTECIKNLCERRCEEFWKRYVQDTGNDITFVSDEVGEVVVSFDEFFEEVFIYTSENPQKDILQYLKKTYIVA